RLPKTHFKDCALEHVDFAYADFSQTFFENCNLKNAIFEQTNLEKANLTSSFNFSINPTQNKIKNAKFSKENCIGLLDSFQIKIE
ncbi:MAG TPA: pentapeptide repeat-containing protein, partial [Faecalibacter sp.]